MAGRTSCPFAWLRDAASGKTLRDRLDRTAMARRAHTLDTVKLLEDWDGWPAGTMAAVVSEQPDSALVEIVTDTDSEKGLPSRELLDDVIAVPYRALEVVQPARAETR